MSRTPEGLHAAILRNLLIQTTRAYDRQLEELERQRELAEVTLASIADGVVVVDTLGSVRKLNAAAERLTGWTAEEAVGRPVREVLRLETESGEGELVPLDHLDLETSAVRGGLEGVFLVRRDGRRFAIKGSVAPIRDLRGEIHGRVVVFADVSEQRLLALQLAHQATRDPLTGLVNRTELQRRLGELLGGGGGDVHALCCLDLDRFKVVNDVAGHEAGDRLLREVADVLRSSVRDADLVARMGGDEFAVLLYGCPPEAAVRLCRVALDRLREHRLRWGESVFTVSASCGVVGVVPGSGTVQDLLTAADSACFTAKERGGDRVLLYEADSLDIRRRATRMRWVVELNRAMEEGRLRLFAQRIQATRGRRAPVRLEVLVRLVNREGRLHTAAEFIEAAEQYGVVTRLDRWVLGAVARTVGALPASVRRQLELVSVNVSGATLGREPLVELAEEVAGASGLRPSQLCFEVTEGAAIRDPERAVTVLELLRRMGFRLALDDFGSGMSSYAYLRELPVHVLKIDRRFVQDLPTSSLDRAMVRSVTEMARLLGLVTVAEGVSSRKAAEIASGLGVDLLQGYWVHRPEPLERVLEGIDGA